MISLNIKQLAEAIRETNELRLPDMTAGTEYLYNRLYRKLSLGEDVRLSELDFNAFTDDDINSLSDLHMNIFEKNEHKANGIASELHRINPEYKPVCYV